MALASLVDGLGRVAGEARAGATTRQKRGESDVRE
jgi:hypothetical protein